MKRPRVIIRNSNPFQPHSIEDDRPWKVLFGYAVIIAATALCAYLLYWW